MNRKGELVGGGFFVFRRGKNSNRVFNYSGKLPFEHPTLESATEEAFRLSNLIPNRNFCVFQQVQQFIREDDSCD